MRRFSLYTSGCSHTHGTWIALDWKFNLTWPRLIQKYYDADLIDHSHNGCSNEQILRKAIDHIVGSAVPPDKVVIQWTKIDRFETPGHGHTPLADIKNNSGPKEFHDFYRKMFPDVPIVQRQLYQKLIRQMYCLQVILEHHHITDWKFIVWPALMCSPNYSVMRSLDHSKIIFNAYDDLYNRGYRFTNAVDPNTGLPDHHFGPDGHSQIADWVINDYTSKAKRSSREMPENVYT